MMIGADLEIGAHEVLRTSGSALGPVWLECLITDRVENRWHKG